MNKTAILTTIILIGANQLFADSVSTTKEALQATTLGDNSAYTLAETQSPEIGAFEILKYLDSNSALTPVRYNVEFNKTLGDASGSIVKYFN